MITGAAPFMSAAGLLGSGGISVGSILGGLSAGGDLLSGLGGMFGGKAKSPVHGMGEALQAQRWSQQIVDQERPSWIRKGAEAAGFHPLAVMGMPPVASGGISIGGGSSAASDFSSMGQGLSRAAQVWASKEERDLQKHAAALALENQQLQNDRLRSEIALMQSPGTAPGLSAHSAFSDTPELFSDLVDRHGRLVTGYSPEAAQQMEPFTITNLYHDLTKVLPDAARADLHHAISQTKKFLNRNSLYYHWSQGRLKMKKWKKGGY